MAVSFYDAPTADFGTSAGFFLTDEKTSRYVLMDWPVCGLERHNKSLRLSIYPHEPQACNTAAESILLSALYMCTGILTFSFSLV